jgi:hypothetical protein
MSQPKYEIRDGFILRPGRLRMVRARERAAATTLIGGFNIQKTDDGLAMGTVVWFIGNTRGFKAPGANGALSPPSGLAARPGGFWATLPDDLRQTMRIDRQKPFNEGSKRFCDYALQVGDDSIACVLVPVNIRIGAAPVRRAFLLSLDSMMNVMIDPTDAAKGYMHIKR